MGPGLSNRQYTVEEFVSERPVDERSELVGGYVVMEPPPGGEHGSFAMSLGCHVRDFVFRFRLGRVLGEAGYILERNPDTVRGPDVSFVTQERWAAAPDKTGYFEGAPDLAIEIASPGDSRRRLTAKARSYLKAGGREVWVVWPKRRLVEVFRPGSPPQLLSENDTLDGGDLLLGFRLRVGLLWEE